MTALITSFGYGHGPAPEADITLDVRKSLRNPHDDPNMRQLTGLDQAVHEHVLDTPGVWHLIRNLSAVVEDLLDAAETVHVAIGCVGGRHRSVAIAEEVAAQIRRSMAVRVEHRDIDKPVLKSAVTDRDANREQVSRDCAEVVGPPEGTPTRGSVT